MTEKEKMLKNKIYDANNDQTLVKERDICKELCYNYNTLRPSQKMRKNEILDKLFGRTGKNYNIQSPFFCDYGYNIEIGENFYMNYNCTILDGAKVKFGDNVYIGPNCGFYTAGHPLDFQSRNMGLEYAYPITVDDNVWIGAAVHVMPGVKIGKNSVIAGGSVVIEDIPENVLAAGNPCRVIRSITEDEMKNIKKSNEEEI